MFFKALAHCLFVTCFRFLTLPGYIHGTVVSSWSLCKPRTLALIHGVKHGVRLHCLQGTAITREDSLPMALIGLNGLRGQSLDTASTRW